MTDQEICCSGCGFPAKAEELDADGRCGCTPPMKDMRWAVPLGDLGIEFHGPKHCFRHGVQLDEKHECALCVAEDEKKASGG